MRKKLIIKSDGAVLAAYVVAPFAAMAVLWLFIFIGGVWTDGLAGTVRGLLMMPWLFIFGVIPCAVAELVFVTPVLLGFHRYHWKWLNGWTAVLLGFFAGSLLMLVVPPKMVGSWADTILFGLVGATIAMVFRLMAITTQDDPA